MLSFLVPVALAALIAWASLYAPLPLPSPFQDLYMAPPAGIGNVAPLEGPLAPNKILQEAEKLFVNKVVAPETIKFDQKGRMYLFTENGIYRALPKGDSFEDPEIFVETKDGRPLSGAFDANETLYVCDVVLGLGKVDIETGKYETVLSNDIVHFCDDIVVSSEGDVFIADAHDRTVTTRQEVMKASFIFVGSGRRGARLLKYTPSTGAVKTLMSDFMFANGVELAPDESYILVSDGSSALKVRRYWLKGPKKGTDDVFMDVLPGYSDGITKGPDSTYWIAVFAPMFFPDSVQESIIDRHEMVLQVDATGKVLRSFHDASNEFGRTTSIAEKDGRLYIGSFNPFVRVIDLEKIPQ